MSYWRDRYLQSAQTLSRVGYAPTPSEIILARRMSRDGKTLKEIYDALGWPCTIQTARKRLKKLNINPFNPSDRAHSGFLTGLPKARGVDTRPYRPKTAEDAA